MNGQAGFFSALFDFSFTTFVTEKLVKWLYAAIIAVLGLGLVVYVVGQLDEGFGSVLAAVIITPVVFLIGVTVARIYLEVVMVLFRIADHTAETAAALGTAGSDRSLSSQNE